MPDSLRSFFEPRRHKVRSIGHEGTLSSNNKMIFYDFTEKRNHKRSFNLSDRLIRKVKENVILNLNLRIAKRNPANSLNLWY